MDRIILDLDSEILPQLEDADKVKRLVNFALDQVFIFITVFIFFFFSGFMIVATGNEISDSDFALSLLGWIWYFLYYFLSEWLMNGRTISKFITRTRAVTENGTFITPKTALVRTICRLIPFEPLVFLFVKKPWHDEFSSTRVVMWPSHLK